MPWRFVLKQIISFLFKVLSRTVVMFFMYNVLHAGYWLSAMVNYALCTVANFFLSKYITFNDRKKSYSQFARFSLNILVCYILAYGVARPIAFAFLKEQEKVFRENVSFFVGMGIFALLNFVGQRIFVFKKSP